jgi:hypothetical protein
VQAMDEKKNDYNFQIIVKTISEWLETINASEMASRPYEGKIK